MTAEATVEATINAARAEATSLSSQAQNLAQQAASVFLSGVQPTLHEATAPEQIIDPDNLPDLKALIETDFGPVFSSGYDLKYRELIERLKLEFTTYLDDYFPDLASEVEQLSDRMMAVVDGSNPLMLSAATQQALLDRHADAANKQLRRTETEINEYWASRGWSMPQGVQVNQLADTRTEVALGISAQSRDIMIRQMELEIENVKFALTTLMGQKMQAIVGAAQYIGVLGRSAADAATYSSQLVNSKQIFNGLATKYYDTYVNMAQLLLQYDELEINKDLRLYGVGVDADVALVSTKVGAAVGAANAVGSIASAAWGSQNSFASIGHETSAED